MIDVQKSCNNFFLRVEPIVEALVLLYFFCWQLFYAVIRIVRMSFMFLQSCRTFIFISYIDSNEYNLISLSRGRDELVLDINDCVIDNQC